MGKSFDTKEFIHDLGNELVSEFEKASKGTHTHAIGGGRELSVINKLRNILPNGIGVGRGFVIDSYGNVSHQSDVIIYEENFALKFAINNDYDNTYYNCESVIAVGEVKSNATKSDIEESIIKLVKVKQLKRFDSGRQVYRKYNSSHSAQQMVFFQGDKPTFRRQIYTFLICKTFRTKEDTIVNLMRKNCNDPKQYPNQILSVDGKVFTYFDPKERGISQVPEQGNHAIIGRTEYAFNNLLMILLRLISYGETVPLNYEPYLGASEPLSIEIDKEIEI